MITKDKHKITHILRQWLNGLLLTLLTALPMKAVAEDFVVNGITYATGVGNEVIVAGISDNIDDILEIPGEVVYNERNYTVTGLGTDCFANKKISALSFNDILVPFNITGSFPKCTIKYLDLTSDLLTFYNEDVLSRCTIERLVISKKNYDKGILKSSDAQITINTLVCLDFVPTGLAANVTTSIIVPNAYAVGSADPRIKGFGDVSDHSAGTFFSFVAGEDLEFKKDGNFEAYVPRENPWNGGTFYLTHKNKSEDFVAAKGAALFLRIKDGLGNKIIPSAESDGSGVSSSLIGSVTAATKTQSEKYYYALKKGEDGLFQYTGSFIPPGVAVVESDQEPPTSHAARAIRMVVEGEPSAIESLQEHEATDACYDLFGNPADAGQSGIRIINGKKVIRR